MTDTIEAEAAEPAILIVADDLDRASLNLGTALAALKTLEQLLYSQPEGLDIGSRRVAPILRCIADTARQGWPLGAT